MVSSRKHKLKSSDRTGANGSGPLGFTGVGLRPVHYPEILGHSVDLDFFEIISENYMDSGGRPRAVLKEIRSGFPIAMHGVSLNIGSPDPVAPHYVDRLGALIADIDPFVVTDHLCWTGTHGHNWHDLFPLPMILETVSKIVSKVRWLQRTLGREIALENVSTYLQFRDNTLTEWDFLTAIAEESDCGILLDVNNIYVNSFNHGFDPIQYLHGIPKERVRQYHLAGHTDMGTFLFDTHSAPVADPVWDLFRSTLSIIGPRPFIIEWDDEIPSFDRLLKEAHTTRGIVQDVTQSTLPLAATL